MNRVNIIHYPSFWWTSGQNNSTQKAAFAETPNLHTKAGNATFHSSHLCLGGTRSQRLYKMRNPLRHYASKDRLPQSESNRWSSACRQCVSGFSILYNFWLFVQTTLKTNAYQSSSRSDPVQLCCSLAFEVSDEVNRLTRISLVGHSNGGSRTTGCSLRWLALDSRVHGIWAEKHVPDKRK